MAKLTAKKPESGVVAGVPPPAVQQQNSAPVPLVQQAAPTTAVPFAINVPGEATAAAPGTGKPNLVQKRQEKIAEALAAGSPFTYVRLETAEFQCICGATGKNAIVLADRNGAEVKVGSNCLRHTGVEVPKQAKESTRVAGAPGVSKQQKFSDGLGKYKAPFVFVRKQDGPFQCFCGGRGQHQIVVRDGSGVEFSVGETCAKLIPGVEVPVAPKVAKTTAPVIAGLKGAVAAPPTFENVS